MAHQTPPRWTPDDARKACIASCLALALGGSVSMLIPFVGVGPSWLWRLDSAENLAKGTVNADVISVAGAGALLARQGARPVSVITPPLEMPDTPHRVAVISARPGGPSTRNPATGNPAAPGRMFRRPRSVTVRFLWQTGPGAAFRYLEKKQVPWTGEIDVPFGLPESPARLYRIGVQFPDLDEPVIVSSVAIPKLSAARRWAAFRDALGETEPIENYSINFLRGPRPLGHSLNYYLVSITAVGIGVYGLIALFRRRRIRFGAIAGLILIAWLAGDAQATHSLWRVSRDELDAFRGASRDELMWRLAGPDIAWAYRALTDHAPDGATYAVVSDDPFAPFHRLGYLVGPRLVRRIDPAGAEFIVVIYSTTAEFDATSGRFRFRAQDWMSAERVAAKSSQVYLLRRAAP